MNEKNLALEEKLNRITQAIRDAKNISELRGISEMLKILGTPLGQEVHISGVLGQRFKEIYAEENRILEDAQSTILRQNASSERMARTTTTPTRKGSIHKQGLP